MTYFNLFLDGNREVTEHAHAKELGRLVETILLLPLYFLELPPQKHWADFKDRFICLLTVTPSDVRIRQEFRLQHMDLR